MRMIIFVFLALSQCRNGWAQEAGEEQITFAVVPIIGVQCGTSDFNGTPTFKTSYSAGFGLSIERQHYFFEPLLRAFALNGADKSPLFNYALSFGFLAGVPLGEGHVQAVFGIDFASLEQQAVDDNLIYRLGLNLNLTNAGVGLLVDAFYGEFLQSSGANYGPGAGYKYRYRGVEAALRFPLWL